MARKRKTRKSAFGSFARKGIAPFGSSKKATRYKGVKPIQRKAGAGT